MELDNKLYKTIFETSPIPKCITKAFTGEFVDVNESFIYLSEYSKEEIIGKKTTDLLGVYNEYRSHILDLLNKDGVFKNLEIEITTKSGKILVGLCSGEVVNGFTITSFVDITCRKKIERKLLFMSKAMNSINVAIGISDASGKHIYQNKATTKLFGYTTEEMETGRNVVKDPNIAKDMYDNIMGGKSWEGELEMVKKSGEIFPAYEYADAIKNDDGDIVGLIGIVTDMSKIKDTEILLKASETRYRRLFEAAKDGILILDADSGKILDVNPFLVNLLGFSKEQFIEKFIWDIGFFKDIVSNKEKFLQLKTDEYVRYDNLPIESYDGNQVNVEFVSNVYLANGHKVVQCNIRDITEKRKIDEALIESEAKFKNIFNKSPIGIALYGDDGILHEMNESCLEIFGIESYEDILYMNLFHDQQKIELKKILDDKLYWEGNVNFDFDKIKTYGKLKTTRSGKAYLNMTVVKYKFNGASYMIMVQDVTEMIQKNEEIQRSELIFKTIFEESPLGKELYDEDGLLLEVNDSCLEIFGVVDKKDIINFKLFEDPNLPPDIKEILDKEKIYEHIIEFDFDLVKKHNLYRTKKTGKYFLNIIINEVNYGSTKSYLVNVQDVTERRKYLQQLEELNNTKDKFFSIISHDLRSPFNSIIGFSSILNDNYDKWSDTERKDAIKNIEQASKNTFNLLQNLLDWSITQSKKTKFNPEYVDFSNIVNNTIRMLKPQAEMKHIKITTCVAFNTTIHVDENMIQTVVRNMLSNAIKYTKKNGKIIISNKKIEENGVKYLQICIQDNGIGISEENINKLFKLGEKFKSTGTFGEKGSSLGLIICKEFIEKHNGRIWVESELGKGSNFYFTVPL
jgi:PAS domain S-box-containing protein